MSVTAARYQERAESTDRGSPGSGRARSARRILKPLVFLLALVPLGLLVFDAFTDRLGANPIEEIQLRTGRWALRFLAITLSVTPLRRISGWNELIKYRRMLGLFAFFYATLHLGNYIGLDMFFDVSDIVEDIVEHPYITLGMTAWLMLVPLAVTSTRGWVRRLGGKRWNQLHRLIYVAAIAATVHYLWAVKKDTYLPLVYLTVFVILLGWRLWAWNERRRRILQTRAREEALRSSEAARAVARLPTSGGHPAQSARARSV